jgi:hypothetical protein
MSPSLPNQPHNLINSNSSQALTKASTTTIAARLSAMRKLVATPDADQVRGRIQPDRQSPIWCWLVD